MPLKRDMILCAQLCCRIPPAVYKGKTDDAVASALETLLEKYNLDARSGEVSACCPCAPAACTLLVTGLACEAGRG